MAGPLALVWDLIAKDSASPAFLRVAGAADKAATSTANAAKKIEGTSARMAVVGSKMTKAITLPLLGIAAVSVDQAAKFQKSMTLIQTAGGETAAKTAVISAGIKKVAIDTGTSLSQLGEGIYTVAKAGGQKWSAVDQLTVLKAAAQGAKAENVPLAVSVQALTSVMAGYGSSAKNAVSVENELIRGSGLAKTTMQDFAGSLANVVPLASSVGIKFSEVAGAIATMTQHGETAQRATENLSNLITNLAGQNNVASSAMQQLGINTVDLQKNLGTRGLTGTLDLVTKAMKDHTKNGMIVTSTLRDSKLAVKSLHEELDTMSGAEAKQSQGLLKGSVGIKDYTSYAKSMGGQAGATALQFLALYKSSQGFSDQLKSGNGTIRTSATELQKMLGGVTGMRTALMLGGTSAATFATNVDKVAQAANAAGTNVLGWGKTSQTLGQQLDVAKENLQVLAVEIGTALIPVVTKMATAVSGAVHWFSSLTGTQKQILGWGLGILAALGPILAIGGRLALVGGAMSTFVASTTAKLATLAGVSEVTATRIGLAMSRVGLALGGAALGFAVGTLTANSSKATQAIGVLASAAAGAAMGAAAGPWGALIGGVAGAVGALAGDFFNAGGAAKKSAAEQVAAAQAAKRAIQEQAAAVGALTDAMKADNDMIGKNTQQQIQNDLQKSGAFDIAQKLNISTKTLSAAAMGDPKAQGQLAATATKIVSQPGLVGAGGSSVTEMAELDQVLKAEGIDLHLAALHADQFAEANGKLKLSTRSVADQFAMYGTSLNSMNLIGKQNLKFIDSHIAALLQERAAGKLSAASFTSQVGGLKSALAQYGYNTTGVDQFSAALKKVPPKVLTRIEKNGVTPAEIQYIIDKYGALPSTKNTSIWAHDHATPTLIAIQGHIAGIHDKSVTISVGYNTNDGIKLAGTGKVLSASGGYISGPGSGTSDSIPAMLSNGEYVVNAKQTAAHHDLLHAINNGVRGFATGGKVTAKKAVDIVRNGIHYSSQSAADNAATRALSALGAEVVKFTAALGKSTDEMKTAEAALLKDMKSSGESKAMLNSITKDFAKLNTLATKRDALQTQLGTPDKAATQTAYEKLTDALSTYTGEISTVASAITSGFNITAPPASGPPSAAYQQALARSNGGGAPMPGDEALLGAGDGTDSAPSVTQMIGSLGKSISAARTFRTELAKLKKEGLSDTLYKQLAEGGVSTSGATVDSLATNATAAQIKQLTTMSNTLNKIATGTGKDVANSLEGKAVKAAEATVSELKAQTQTLVTEIRHIGADVADALNGVASKSHQKARAKK